MPTPDGFPPQSHGSHRYTGDPGGPSLPPRGGSHAYPVPPATAPRLRRRVLDWVIGALAMLGILFLALLLFWLSITQPSGSTEPTPLDGSSPSLTPTPRPGAGVTPPSDLAEDEVWLGDVSLDASSVFAAGTPLRDVVGTGTDVRSGPNGLVAGHLDLTATVPFDAVAEQLGPDSTVSAAGGGEARVDTRVEALGRSLPVGATGTVRVVDGMLVMAPTAIDIGAPDFISELLGDVVREFVTIEYRIEGLPEGVVLRSVRVLDDGFRANLTGDDVHIVQ